MATENTKNNASQTLFRFVNLRNPQLTETKNNNLGFIHRPKEVLGFFDQQLIGLTNETAIFKFNALEKAAGGFTNLYTQEKDLETQFPGLLKAGRKISRQEELNSDDVFQMSLGYQTLFTNSSDYQNLRKLWDNLIYQVITQQDFYIKEAIVHILKAFHYGYSMVLIVNDDLTKINGNDLPKKALEGKVVLPVSLFGDGSGGETSSSNITGNPFQVNISKIGEGVINGTQLTVAIQQQLRMEGEKISERSFLEMEKNELLLLKSELEKIQKTFYKFRTKAYTAARKEYTYLHQSTLDGYDVALEKIDAQVHEDMTQEEKERIDALYDELGEPNVPKFEFEYRNELNFEDLKEKLSLDLFSLFIENFTLINDGLPTEVVLDYSQIVIVSDKKILISNVPVSITEDYDTFGEVYEKLEEEISVKTQASFDKSPVKGQEFAKIGSVLIPVNKTTYTEISGTYYLNVETRDSALNTRNFLTFYYNTDSPSLGLVSANVQMAGHGENTNQDLSSIDVVNGKVTFPMITGNLKEVTAVKITLYFKNGEYTVIEHTNIVSNQLYTGRFSFRTKVEEEDNGNSGEGGENTGGTANPSSGTFIPKHFGVKRLGIADYLKVEQSVHAYVPGEVSNIENVMASELRHKSSVARDYSEITDTTSESVETEKISDTTKTERNEMQTEVAKELEKQQSIEANTRFSYGTSKTYFEIGGSYANNTAQHDSTRQAVAKSQEITERAMERVLTKINKERVQKVIKEFTETNVHEFDNRGKGTIPTQHITGVYRWVDKKMKNQIYDYGKRTMFEFMIPEPAKLHRLAFAVNKSNQLIAPVDPRKAPSPKTMTDSKSATRDLLTYWADVYGVTLTEIKEKDQRVENVHDEFNDKGNCIVVQRNFAIPTNYVCKSVDVSYSATREKSGRNIEISGDFTNGIGFNKYNVTETFSLGGFNLSGNWVFKNSGYNIGIVDISLKLNLEIQPSLFEAWKQENFDAIIKAYEAAYADFLAKQKELEDQAKEEEENNKEKLGNFYRDMEAVILKHNCIAYLLQDYFALGKKFTNDATEMKSFSIALSDDLDKYTSLAKFMEQAFEWSIMDYTFYPYYWADHDEWQTMYLSESSDPLFRNFLQSGMARVIVTVKPGFEDAVQFFMSTGKIWNGGEVPVIGDPLYMSIVDELRQPTGKPQGKYWITRIPTTLTILQAESVGLKVDQPLPIFPEDDPKNCENPKELETVTSFFKDENIRMESPDDKPTTLPTTIVG